MIIPIPYGSRYTAQIKVTLWIPLQCEWCAEQYAYAKEVNATGEADSFLWINRQGAKSRAAHEAADSLLSQIDHARSRRPPVRCPKCGKFGKSEASYLAIQRRDERMLIMFGIGFGGVAAASFLLIAAFSIGSTLALLASLAAVCAALVGYVALWRTWVSRRYDPNAPHLLTPHSPFDAGKYPVLIRPQVDEASAKWRAQGRLVIDPKWPDS